MEFGCVCPRRVQDGALESKNDKANTEAIVGSPISSNNVKIRRPGSIEDRGRGQPAARAKTKKLARLTNRAHDTLAAQALLSTVKTRASGGPAARAVATFSGISLRGPLFLGLAYGLFPYLLCSEFNYFRPITGLGYSSFYLNFLIFIFSIYA